MRLYFLYASLQREDFEPRSPARKLHLTRKQLPPQSTTAEALLCLAINMASGFPSLLPPISCFITGSNATYCEFHAVAARQSLFSRIVSSDYENTPYATTTMGCTIRAWRIVLNARHGDAYEKRRHIIIATPAPHRLGRRMPPPLIKYISVPSASTVSYWPLRPIVTNFSTIE